MTIKDFIEINKQGNEQTIINELKQKFSSTNPKTIFELVKKHYKPSAYIRHNNEIWDNLKKLNYRDLKI